MPIYAIDMGEGEGSPVYDATTANGVSPSWRFDAGGRDGVTCDIMVPTDRNPGEDLRFYFYYAPAAAGGAGNVYWGIDYVLYPNDGYGGGIGLNPARTIRGLTPELAPFGVVMKRSNTYVAIPGNDLTNIEQIQMQFVRLEDLAEDADGRNMYLFKVIMEYVGGDQPRFD